MSDDIIPFKVCLSNELVERVRGETDVDLNKVVRMSIFRFLSTYVTKYLVSQLIKQYIEQVEELLEERLDNITNLLTSLSYVSKFNNTILNSIFVDKFGTEAELECFYDEAAETVQKYFQFDDDQENRLPIIKENDQLKAKILELEKQVKANDKT